MPLFKADLVLPPKTKTATYPIDLTAYAEAKDIVEAATKFNKYATSKKGKVEFLGEVSDNTILL